MMLMLLIHSPLLPLSSNIPCTILVFIVYTMTWIQGDKKLEIVNFRNLKEKVFLIVFYLWGPFFHDTHTSYVILPGTGWPQWE